MVDLGIERIRKQTLIPFFIPSRDNRCDIGTMQSLSNLSLFLLQKFQLQSVVYSANASNIPRSRNQCLRGLDLPDTNNGELFCLWLDDDMIITGEHFPYLSTMMEYALSMPRRTIVVTNYRTMLENFRPQLMRHRHLEPSNEVWVPGSEDRYQDLGQSGASGLGMAIGWFPREYVFHADEFGEDIYFWYETKINMIVDTAWIPGHRKEMVI